jgi:hypothetical protein
VQWKVALLETKSTIVDDAGFTMLAMIPTFKLTVLSIYMMFDDNYVRQIRKHMLIWPFESKTYI